MSVIRAANALNKFEPEEVGMARLRSVAMTKSLKALSDEVYLSHDDPDIDFASAGLYLVGLQTTVATVACASTSVACCWLMPFKMISAVRTLAITAVVGFLFMRKPLRVGKTRGVTTIFNALRPCVALFICVLTIEQLVHTCVSVEQKQTAYTRRVLFHCSISLMIAAGIWRAAKPLSETDAPFLATVAAIVVIAMLPPSAAALSGPLCEAATFFTAGERLLRAFLFAALYVIHVYCSPPQRNSIHDLAVCIMRSAAAAVWIMGCHLFVVWVAVVQAIVALWARFGQEPVYGSYTNVDTRSDSGLSDAELGALPDVQLTRNENGILMAPVQRDAPSNGYSHGFPRQESITSINGGGMQLHRTMHDQAAPSSEPGQLAPERAVSPSGDGVRVDPRQLASYVGQGVTAFSKERMAAIAASM